MNPLCANFDELYRRHMCRHSQFGINVLHFISLIGTYWALYGCAYSLLGTIWPLVAVATAYLAILAFNVPVRVLALALLALGGFFAVLLTAPVLPFYVYLLTLYPFYKLQSVSHRYYSRAYDMTEFNRKYPKGFGLFVLLSTYELPIQLNAIFLQPPYDPAAAQAPGAPEPAALAGVSGDAYLGRRVTSSRSEEVVSSCKPN